MAIPAIPAQGAPWLTYAQALDAEARTIVDKIGKWKPNTAYTAGDPVVNPSGQLVTANTTFTSGASYNAANWTVTAGGGGGGTTTDASLLTSGILPAARIADASIADAKLASGTALTSAERTKLTGIATGATANSPDATLLARANHTGTQAASTVTGLATVATTGAYTDLTAKPTIPTVGAAGAGAAVALSSTDPSVTNARTPSAHTHPASDLTATGTRDATTFLRGDNTWATPAGGGGGAGLPATIVNRTTAYTAAAGDFVQADVTTAGFTVTLPAAPAVGALVAVKKVDATANTLTIAPSGGGTIDGDPTATTTTKMAGAIFEHVGTNVWRIVASMTTTGPAGPTGPTGAAGTAATVAVGTTTTLAAGASATVTNAGTTSAAVFNFGIPQGAAGSSGTSLETTTAPPSTNTTGSVLGTATTAAHADHTHAIGAHDHTTTAKGGQVPVGGLSATGTKDATTFLRGDNTWAAPWVQMTAAAYTALGTKDPNTLYVIVG